MDICFTTSTFERLLNNFGKSGWRHLVGWSLHQLACQVLPGSKEDSFLPGLLVPTGRRKHSVTVRQALRQLCCSWEGLFPYRNRGRQLVTSAGHLELGLAVCGRAQGRRWQSILSRETWPPPSQARGALDSTPLQILHLSKKGWPGGSLNLYLPHKLLEEFQSRACFVLLHCVRSHAAPSATCRVSLLQ